LKFSPVSEPLIVSVSDCADADIVDTESPNASRTTRHDPVDIPVSLVDVSNALEWLGT
jgi:hypothetical protein